MVFYIEVSMGLFTFANTAVLASTKNVFLADSQMMESGSGSNNAGTGTIVQQMSHDDKANPYTSEVAAYADYGTVANESRLSRLFSFVQLLTFAMTFISSWEVVAM